MTPTTPDSETFVPFEELSFDVNEKQRYIRRAEFAYHRLHTAQNLYDPLFQLLAANKAGTQWGKLETKSGFEAAFRFSKEIHQSISKCCDNFEEYFNDITALYNEAKILYEKYHVTNALTLIMYQEVTTDYKHAVSAYRKAVLTRIGIEVLCKDMQILELQMQIEEFENPSHPKLHDAVLRFMKACENWRHITNDIMENASTTTEPNFPFAQADAMLMEKEEQISMLTKQLQSLN